MNGKNHNSGFTLIETVIATAILGIMVTSVYALISVSMQGDVRGAARLSRIIMLKNALSDPELFADDDTAKEKGAASTRETNIKEPKTRIVVTQSQASQGALASYKHLVLALAQASWDLVGIQEQEQLALYHCVVPPVKKKAKGP